MGATLSSSVGSRDVSLGQVFRTDGQFSYNQVKDGQRTARRKQGLHGCSGLEESNRND